MVGSGSGINIPDPQYCMLALYRYSINYQGKKQGKPEKLQHWLKLQKGLTVFKAEY
jgi:hypothetical protein